MLLNKPPRILARLFSVIFVFGCISVLLLGCSSEQSEREEIRLGAILPLTGGLGFLGQQELVGLELGEGDVNRRWSKKGLQLKLLVEDSQSKASRAATIANKLIHVDKVDVLFVTTSSAVQAVVPIADKAQVPVLIMASEPGLTKLSPYAFRIYMNFDDEAKTIADYIKRVGYKKIALIRANLQAFDMETKLLRQYLGTSISILEEHLYEYGSKDFRTILEKVATTPFDAVCILGVGPELPTLVAQILENEKIASVPIVGGYLFLSEPAQAQGTSIYSNVTFASFPFTLSSPQVKRFAGRTTQEGNDLSVFTDYVYTYDSIQFLSIANEARKGSESIFDAMKRIDTFTGAAGTHKLNEFREISVPMRMAQFINGELKLIERY